jgi:hypothetical protein
MVMDDDSIYNDRPWHHEPAHTLGGRAQP